MRNAFPAGAKIVSVAAQRVVAHEIEQFCRQHNTMQAGTIPAIRPRAAVDALSRSDMAGTTDDIRRKKRNVHGIRGTRSMSFSRPASGHEAVLDASRNRGRSGGRP